MLGKITKLKGVKLEKSSNQYLNTFPYARTMNPHFWEMKLTFIKMTHNKLGFGRKLTWEI